jgi:hypothetical protein
VSRTWTRATKPQPCGGPCLGDIAPGDPMLVIALGVGQRVRCQACAGEPVDLAQLARSSTPQLEEQPGGFARLGEIARVVPGKDVKQAQAGDTE